MLIHSILQECRTGRNSIGMRLNDEERRIIVNLEYERACTCLKQAEGNASMDFWDVVANRLYYAVFHAVSALLIRDGYNVSTHRGTLVMFGQHYVKTGIFTADASSLYVKLQTMREKSDYNCVYITTAEEMQPLFEPVREFLAKVGNLIKE